MVATMPCRDLDAYPQPCSSGVLLEVAGQCHHRALGHAAGIRALPFVDSCSIAGRPHCKGHVYGGSGIGNRRARCRFSRGCHCHMAKVAVRGHHHRGCGHHSADSLVRVANAVKRLRRAFSVCASFDARLLSSQSVRPPRRRVGHRATTGT